MTPPVYPYPCRNWGRASRASRMATRLHLLHLLISRYVPYSGELSCLQHLPISPPRSSSLRTPPCPPAEGLRRALPAAALPPCPGPPPSHRTTARTRPPHRPSPAQGAHPLHPLSLSPHDRARPHTPHESRPMHAVRAMQTLPTHTTSPPRKHRGPCHASPPPPTPLQALCPRTARTAHHPRQRRWQGRAVPHAASRCSRDAAEMQPR